MTNRTLAPLTEKITEETPVPRRGTPWRRLRKSPSAMLGLAIVLLFMGAGLLAEWIAPYDPLRPDFGRAREGPSSDSLLGRDELGRDILSRIIYGARISLWIGFIAVAIGVALGVPLGAISGYYGRLDIFVQRLVDIMLAFPGLLLAIVLISILGVGLSNVMIAIGVASIPTYARLVRSSVLSLREMDYVSAAKALGMGDGRIIFRHILPNCLAPIIVQSTLQIATAILFAAGLGFLGLGAKPPMPEWGVMLSTGRDYLRDWPHISTFPGLAIMLSVLGFNLLGDGLRDIFDPRLRGKL
ncbi:ABC transporter permease [Candidatus Acetothermia bacterium]|jgi:ABC-type dipeptide/oligopeptide/nickel transport system permease subunit|nr:ABC transporter permease [Candidatus Acetothermia bacterium]MCI2431711.1 ABC transporter permease [Candidatus Acetothermia bacterium]MCI2436693.1 ABC transporter permease [Candidatus Acetothermia bacterium]